MECCFGEGGASRRAGGALSGVADLRHKTTVCPRLADRLGWMLEEAHGGELDPGVASREPGLASRMQNPFSHQICHGSAFLTVGIDLDERFRPGAFLPDETPCRDRVCLSW